MSFVSRRSAVIRPLFNCIASAALLLAAFAPTGAHAIIQGSPSSLGSQTVQIVARGNSQCTGVILDRMHVATARHCGSGTIISSGQSVAVAAIANSATLADGTRVRVSGDAAILRLRAPLPGSASPVRIGGNGGSTFTVAGYGATSEANGGAVGALHEASLVRAGPRALIDPRRDGAIGASACFGDSGGPVMQGSALVGIITRASHPSPRIACGHLTHFTPIVAVGRGAPTASAEAAQTERTRAGKRQRAAARVRAR